MPTVQIMQKATILLVVISGVVGLGLILSFYGNQVLFEGLTNGEGSIGTGEDIIISAELNRADSQNGIYAVQLLEYVEGVSVHVLDPFGNMIESVYIDGDLSEGVFPVESDGIYSMVVKNDGSEKAEVFGVIGPEPDAGAKSIGFISLYVLVIGLAGMLGVGVFAFRKRKRT